MAAILSGFLGWNPVIVGNVWFWGGGITGAVLMDRVKQTSFNRQNDQTSNKGHDSESGEFLDFAPLDLPPFAAIQKLRSWPVTEGEIQSAHRACAKEHHPDVGGDATKFKKIQRARDEALQAIADLRQC